MPPHDLTDRLNTNNWFDYSYFYEYLAQLDDIKTVVEVGSWKGHSITHLAKQMLLNNKKFKLFCVDIWNEWEFHTEFNNTTQHELLKDVRNSYEIFQENLKLAGVTDHITAIKLESLKAVGKFNDGEVDCVFLDADHSYKAVIDDIDAWMPKIRSGGILAGHDYNQPSCGVKKAVDEKFGKSVSIMGQVWYLNV